MLVNGSDCSIVIKTAHREIDVPYGLDFTPSSETKN